MTKTEIIRQFGFDPETVGLRHRGYFIVEEIEEEEAAVNARVGDLCIRARDGGGNGIDGEAYTYGNFIGDCEDFFDNTYRYYYYRSMK